MPLDTFAMLPGEEELSRAWAVLAETEGTDPVRHHRGAVWRYEGSVRTASGWVHVFAHPDHPRNPVPAKTALRVYKGIGASAGWIPSRGRGLRLLSGGLH